MNKFDLDLFSIILRTNIKIHILVPYPNMKNDDATVVWALHPAFKTGSFYYEELGLGYFVDSSNICLVCPDLGNNFFIDNRVLNIGDALRREIYPYVDKLLKAVYSQSFKRKAVGISLGAYGALSWHIYDNSVFDSLFLVSGSYEILSEETDERLKSKRSQKSLLAIVSSICKRLFDEETKHDLNLINKVQSITDKNRKIKLFCGEEDYLCIRNTEKLYENLKRSGVNCSLCTHQGEHDTKYWRTVCSSIFEKIKCSE